MDALRKYSRSESSNPAASGTATRCFEPGEDAPIGGGEIVAQIAGSVMGREVGKPARFRIPGGNRVEISGQKREAIGIGLDREIGRLAPANGRTIRAQVGAKEGERLQRAR